MARCVICGKKQRTKSVSTSHIKTHDMTRDEYLAKAAKLPEAAWELYWKSPKLQQVFPNPTGRLRKAVKGYKTFAAWVAEKHPEM